MPLSIPTAALGVISLATPAMLAGLALLALPIAAHLLHRRSKQRVVFPSVVLLAATAASQSSLFKLRRWLLLLLRCLVVALIVLAFAFPVWRGGESRAGQAGGAPVTVIVLDVSPSTGQQADGLAAFEAMRGSAGSTIDSTVAAGGRVSVVLATGQPRPLYPEPTRNTDGLHAELADLAPSHERADLAGAVALAGRILTDAARPGAAGGAGRVVVISDLQATNWEEASEAFTDAPPLPAGTDVQIVPPPAAAPGNLAVLAARTSPPAPTTGQAAYASVATVALGSFDAEPREVEVRLLLDGDPLARQVVRVDPWGQQEVAFPFTLPDDRPHALTFEISGDALAADNRRFHAVVRGEPPRVRLVADGSPDDPQTSAYFLTRALQPRQDGHGPVHASHLRTPELSPEALRGIAAVFIGRAAPLTPAAHSALLDYLHEGGVAVLFCDDRPPALAAPAGSDGGTLLPYEPVALRDLAAEGQALLIASGDWRSPLLRDFGAREQEALARVRFLRAWAVGEPAADASVLLRYNDGTPALAARLYGRGQVVLANFGLGSGAGDFVKHGSFVALVHAIVRHAAAGAGDDAGAVVGSPLQFTLGRDAVTGVGLALHGPDGRPHALHSAASDESRITLGLSRTPTAGFYRLTEGPRLLALAATNLDPREADLRRIDPAALHAILSPGGPAGAAGDAVAAQPPGRGDVSESPLWGYALLAAMLGIATEMALISYWRR